MEFLGLNNELPDQRQWFQVSLAGGVVAVKSTSPEVSAIVSRLKTELDREFARSQTFAETFGISLPDEFDGTQVTELPPARSARMNHAVPGSTGIAFIGTVAEA